MIQSSMSCFQKNEACAGLNDISEQAEGSESSDEDVAVQKPNIGQLIRKLENDVSVFENPVPVF